MDYSERKKVKKWNDTKLQAAAMRRRAASATLTVASVAALAAKPGPWLDLTPGARFTAVVRCSAACIGCVLFSSQRYYAGDVLCASYVNTS